MMTTYLRGANLISDGTNYYLYNAHGDVVQLTDSAGAVTKTYEYDAFGNEKNPSDTDTNPFRYCGEYYDSETGNYYLRARYYDPTVGRFTQEDTHWNTANMIYGDTMQKLNVTVDADGGEYFTAIPQMLAIRQAGNLYGYAVNSPVMYADPTGNSIILTCILVGVAVGLFAGAAIGHEVARYNGYDGTDGWNYWKYVTGWGIAGGVAGGLVGWGVGAFLTVPAAAGAGGTAVTLGNAEFYQSWQETESALRKSVDSVTAQIDRSFYTPHGQRIADAFNKSSRLIAESKYGYYTLTNFVRQEILKDAYLLSSGTVNFVEWHFYISQQTGLGGASSSLIAELIKHGFKVVFHC